MQRCSFTVINDSMLKQIKSTQRHFVIYPSHKYEMHKGSAVARTALSHFHVFQQQKLRNCQSDRRTLFVTLIKKEGNFNFFLSQIVPKNNIHKKLNAQEINWCLLKIAVSRIRGVIPLECLLLQLNTFLKSGALEYFPQTENLDRQQTSPKHKKTDKQTENSFPWEKCRWKWK